MPYYLTDYVGAGTYLDKFRPRGSEQQGWSAIDLRPQAWRKDGGGLNACLLYVPEHDPSLYKIADEQNEGLCRAVRSRFRHYLDHVSPFRLFNQCIADLLLDPPRNAWKALRGAPRVYLGGLLWQMPVMAGGASYSESWNAADTGTGDAASLNADLTWTKSVNNNLCIRSQKGAYFSANDGVYGRMNTQMSSANFYAQLTISSLVPVGSSGNVAAVGPIVRLSGSSFANFYVADSALSVDGTTFNGHEFMKVVSGSFSYLQAADPTDHANGEVLKLQAFGSTITLFRNGSTFMGPVTDTAIDGSTVGGQYAGVFGFHNGTLSTVAATFDDWSAEDLNFSRPMFRGS